MKTPATKLLAAIIAITATATTPTLAANPFATAKSLAAICHPNTPACEQTLTGYLAGYAAGLRKGVRSTFTHDPQTLATTNGHEETYQRYRQVIEKSSCVPKELSPEKAASIFLAFIAQNPGTEQEPAADVLESALDAAFRCPD